MIIQKANDIIQEPFIYKEFSRSLESGGVIYESLKEVVRSLISNDIACLVSPDYRRELLDKRNKRADDLDGESSYFTDFDLSRIGYSLELDNFDIDTSELTNFGADTILTVRTDVVLRNAKTREIVTRRLAVKVGEFHGLNELGLLRYNGTDYTIKNTFERVDSINSKRDKKDNSVVLSIVINGKQMKLTEAKGRSRLEFKLGGKKVYVDLLELAVELFFRDRGVRLEDVSALYELEVDLIPGHDNIIENVRLVCGSDLVDKKVIDEFNEFLMPLLIDKFEIKDGAQLVSGLATFFKGIISDNSRQRDLFFLNFMNVREDSDMSNLRNTDEVYNGTYLENAILAKGVSYVKDGQTFFCKAGSKLDSDLILDIAGSNKYIDIIDNDFYETTSITHLVTDRLYDGYQILEDSELYSRTCAHVIGDNREVRKKSDWINSQIVADGYNDLFDSYGYLKNRFEEHIECYGCVQDMFLDISSDDRSSASLIEYYIHCKACDLIYNDYLKAPESEKEDFFTVANSKYLEAKARITFLNKKGAFQKATRRVYLTLDNKSLENRLTLEDVLVLVSIYNLKDKISIDRIVSSIDMKLQKKLLTFPDYMRNYVKSIKTKSMHDIYSYLTNNAKTEYEYGINFENQDNMIEVFDKVLRDTAYDNEEKLEDDFYSRKSTMLKFFSSNLRDNASYLYKSKLLNFLTFKNPIYYLSELTNIGTQVSSESISDDMRLFSPLSFGRICMYETPESKKIGVTTHMSTFMKLDKGVLCTPYFKVVGSGDDLRLDRSQWVYLTPEDELDKVVTNIDVIEPFLITGTDKFDSSKLDSYISAKSPVNSRYAVDFSKVPLRKIQYVSVSVEQGIGYAASFLPWQGNNMAVRTTFASSQIKQAKPLLLPQEPYIQTPIYRQVVDYFNLLQVKAPISGVFHLNREKGTYVIRGEKEAIERRIPKTITSLISVISYKKVAIEGKYYNKGDVLYVSNLVSNGAYAQGVNAIVAFITTENNFEDGVPISRRLGQKLTSIGSHSYEVEVTLGKKESIKDISLKGISFNKYYGGNKDKKGSLVVKGTMSVEKETDINEDIKGFIYAHSGREDKAGRANRFKGESANTRKYLIKSLTLDEARVGDKVVNRFGNKGTIPTNKEELDNSSMPYFNNGEFIDIAYNTLGIPSRANYGQLMEAASGFAMYLLGIPYLGNTTDTMTIEEIKEYINFVYDLANAESREIFNSVIDSRSDLLPTSEMREYVKNRFTEITYWRGVFDRECRAYLYDPDTGKPMKTKAYFGVLYVYKLEHEAENKILTRSLPNRDYARIDSKKQTPKPKPKTHGNKGEALGNMEIWSYLAYGAANAIYENMNDRGDNYGRRNALLCEQYNKSEFYDYEASEIYASRRSLEMLHGYLRAWNIKLEFDSNDDDEKFLNSLNISEDILNKRAVISETAFYSKTAEYEENDLDEFDTF